jgi:hypothetical protein
MSFIKDNKDIIHIATETVVVVGLGYYIHASTSNLRNHISELRNNLDSTRTLVNTHEQTIKQLIMKIEELQQQVSLLGNIQLAKKTKQVPTPRQSISQTPPNPPTVIRIPSDSIQPAVEKAFETPNIQDTTTDIEELEELEESDALDAELKEEIEELEKSVR